MPVSYLRGLDPVPAGFVKLAFPFTSLSNAAFFVEGDANPTFQNVNTGYRVVFGFQFGNWMRPTTYGVTQAVVPVSVPRPNYELIAR